MFLKTKKNGEVLKINFNISVKNQEKEIKQNMGRKKKIKKIKKKKIKKTKEKSTFDQSVKPNKYKSKIFKANEVKIKKITKQPTEKRIYKVKDHVVYPKHGVGQIVAAKLKLEFFQFPINEVSWRKFIFTRRRKIFHPI